MIVEKVNYVFFALASTRDISLVVRLAHLMLVVFVLDKRSPNTLCHVVDGVDQMMPKSVCVFFKIEETMQSSTKLNH